MEVKSISAENHSAIEVIMRQNENTSAVASSIKEQSQQNKDLSDELHSIINKFSM